MFARAMTREAARSREVVPESTITRRILGMRVDATTYDRATERVLRWAEEGSSRYVCIANVHMVMEAYDDDDLQQLVNRADLVTSDGMPLVWGLKAMGVPEAERVCGPLLTPAVMERAARDGVPIGLYGGANERALRRLIDALYARFPTLKIAFAAVPPYRPLTPEEDEALIGKIVESGARILFVGLGCPKQEFWMAEHRGRVPCVMLGVGAAFSFLSGDKPIAPAWMQRNGLEWLFRLLTEPGRLWRRYVRQNPRVLVLFLFQLLGWRRYPSVG